MEMAHGEGGVALYIVHGIVIAERWIMKHTHRVDSLVDRLEMSVKLDNVVLKYSSVQFSSVP